MDGYEGIDIARVIAILLIDIVLYALAAWYASQVIPSRFAIKKPVWFFLLPSYWFPTRYNPSSMLTAHEIESVYARSSITEHLDESKWGR